ncbi:hypothetical protein HF325_001735 [Metschnikowia pulcherrima]|uniref:26S proteasome regulatory subunit RPN1 n=1 Tax=Metschnikowia pulcherrima TaxID=27326 RepID=A0A8H7LGQ9_9ASCO|nr:hypothetical protein HF325_001735 [Metschnikowia pulcherrima]
MPPTKDQGPSTESDPTKSKKPTSLEEELSEEDQRLKDDLEQLVERLSEPSQLESVYIGLLNTMKDHIRDSTTSMTAVPKPLKFLRPHFPLMHEIYEKWASTNVSQKLVLLLADVLSVLAMTNSDTGKQDLLKFRLIAGEETVADWGHEYMRHLALEIGEAFQEKSGVEDDYVARLVELSLKIVPFFLHHNAEADAVDLLLEVESIEKLPPFLDDTTYARVCLYMVSCVPLLAPPDDLSFLHTAYSIYLAHGQLTQALTLAIKLDDEKLIKQVFESTEETLVHKQLGFVLAQQYNRFTYPGENEEVQEIISNVKLPEYFSYLAKELNLLEPRVPEDIYKSHLEDSRFSYGSGSIDSAKQNLAASFVNAFTNMGYGNDKLAEASLALLQEHVTDSKKLLQSSAIEGLGIAFAGSANEEVLDLLLPLVSDTDISLENSCFAALALGHVFVGTCHGDITSAILQTVMERDAAQLDSKFMRFMALGLGLLYMGKTESIDDAVDIIDAILHPISKTLKVLINICAYAGTGNVLQIQSLLQMCSAKPKDENARLDEDEEGSQASAVEEAESKIEGDVDMDAPEEATELKAEEKPDAANEDADETDDETEDLEEDEELYQGFAVLGLACIAMGESIGQDMVLRHFSHLMHYGSPLIRRAVPLAMGLVSASYPQMKVFDTLSRYSHDPDLEVSQNAIYAMGLVGAGTNNARLAQLLRQLAQYYLKSPDCLFMVRIAQGILYLGKGTHTLTPFNIERSILNKVSLASLLTVSVAMLDPKEFILSDSSTETTHQLLYYLTPAVKPKMLITVDEDLNPIKVNVRVGQAVDVVGQAGKPKTITGWVTQATPVLLNYGERAELENTEEWISLSHSLEGVVILKKAPDYMEVDT